MRNCYLKFSTVSLCIILLSCTEIFASTKRTATIGVKNGRAGLPSEITMSHQELSDKIKGGWAGQTIGVTYGYPTEFEYRGITIGDDVNIPWSEDCVLRTMQSAGGLYDDIYMDLTFVDIFERMGLDAPTDSIALAFANAPYPLWHANQAARYNILHGIMPPMSGHWSNNPHADDIDYQIEADYAGLMSPAMPNTACEISDRIGHIMNYGDGWYGGVYMGAMYSLAFVTDDVPTIVTQALKCIPKKSKFRKCMEDVIQSWRMYPDDWHKTWEMCSQRWNDDKGCSEGVLMPLNIDAVINSAYVIIGLLYGNGDFGRTIDIATRCGQDSDCNPASAGGILGTAIGYSAIPAYWLDPLKKAEDVCFAYTDMSLNKTYRMSFSHALQVIEREGGRVTDTDVTIRCQRPKPVREECSFEGLEVLSRMPISEYLTDRFDFSAACSGITLCGRVSCPDKTYIAQIEISVDGKKQTIEMPANYHDRRLDIFWDYALSDGKHSFSLVWLNPRQEARIHIQDAVLYKKQK